MELIKGIELHFCQVMRIKLHSRKKIDKISTTGCSTVRGLLQKLHKQLKFVCCFNYLCIHCVLPSLSPLPACQVICCAFFLSFFCLPSFSQFSGLCFCFVLFFALTFASLFSPPMSLCVVCWFLNCTTALLPLVLGLHLGPILTVTQM